jgi:hypothetical protein
MNKDFNEEAIGLIKEALKKTKSSQSLLLEKLRQDYDEDIDLQIFRNKLYRKKVDAGLLLKCLDAMGYRVKVVRKYRTERKDDDQ